MQRSATLASCAVFALSFASFGPERARAGACANPGLEAALLVPPGDRIPVGGHVLLTLAPSFGSGTNDPFPRLSATLSRGSHELPMRVEVLGPGIARLVSHREIRSGRWTLGGVGTERAIEFGGEIPAPAPAPEIVRVEHANTQHRDMRRGTYSVTTVSAVLRGRAPERALGLLVEGGGASLFARLDEGATSALLYRSPGRCNREMPGTSPPHPGSRVRLRWVDVYGRLSPPSAELEVVPARQP